ncbi:MAG: hypothetical protein SFY96_00790 [Planctomycetota bacterium]|nr:hypothetical protein [Planctomycetota bacterium]
MFRRPVLTIELTPIALRVGVVGRSEAPVHVPLERAAWENAWQGGLRALDEPLRTAIRRLGVRPKSRAIVIYDGPDAAADLMTIRGSAGDAEAAARLALRESGLDARSPVACRVFDSTDGGERQTRVLAIGDTTTASESVAEWVRRCGLRLEGMTSTKAVTLQRAISRAGEVTSGDAIILEVAEHATGVVSVSGGRVLFARVIALGCDQLIEALSRGARDVTRNEETMLSREECREILFREGTPSRGTVLSARIGLRGEHVLPLMLPVLQRFSVEIRQSIRFAKMEGAGDNQHVVLSGPGSRIRNLGGSLSELVDTNVEVLSEQAGPTGSTIEVETDAALLYMPQSEVAARASLVVSRGVKIGAAAAFALLGVQGAMVASDLHDQHKRLETLTPRFAEVERNRAARAELSELIQSVQVDRHAIAGAIGPRACWSAGLADLSRAKPDGVTLIEVAGSVEPKSSERDGGPLLTIKGFTGASAAEPSGDGADALVERLRASAVLRGVEFTSSRVIQSDEGASRQFILNARPLVLPAKLALGGQP